MPLLFSRPVTVAVDVAAWGFIHASTGYFVHRLPLARLERDGFVHRERRMERGGRFYVERLRIKRWKRLLPEAGDVFTGGFNKRHLAEWGGPYLIRYAAETRRAELGHWLAVAAAPLFFLWNPYQVGFVMLAYALVVNGPCLAAQRYNRLRLTRILAEREARERHLPGPSGFS
jgi:glycosyl-4,4'-diaponeurosporenoate acyltransferase